jgi:hypothetical protein
MRASAARVALVGAAAALVAAAPAAGAPEIEQLVVQKNGTARQAKVKASKAHVHVHGDNCTVPSGTSLAALVLSDVPGVKLKDYGACSSRARDAAGLFVRAIDGDANKGADGWVYKVGRRWAPAGAADPAGPFGNGRLKDGARVTWFYCRSDSRRHGCQRTLDVKLTPDAGADVVHVHVTAYDDSGHGKPAAHATVHSGPISAKADDYGDTDIPPPGRHRVYADKKGSIRSFGERLE